jgi:hypothetical protein
LSFDLTYQRVCAPLTAHSNGLLLLLLLLFDDDEARRLVRAQASLIRSLTVSVGWLRGRVSLCILSDLQLVSWPIMLAACAICMCLSTLMYDWFDSNSIGNRALKSWISGAEAVSLAAAVGSPQPSAADARCSGTCESLGVE